MDIAVYSIRSVSDEHISSMLKANKSFVLEDISRTNMGEAVKTVEKIIESMGLRCRVYSKGRSATLAAELAVPFVGWAAAAAMGIHNVATWNPDYEIAKNILTGTLTVTYKKK